MGDDFDFRKKLGERPRQRRGRVVQFRRPSRRKKLSASFYVGRLVATGLIIGSAIGLAVLQYGSKLPSWSVAGARDALDIGCDSPKVLDGDTLRCGPTRIRLSSIDAPELPGHCRPGRQCTPGDPYASAHNLRWLVTGQTVKCRQVDTDHYGRAVAKCSVQGRDLSCAQTQGGFAVERYGTLTC